ncbi:hypothetical protein SAMN02745857_02754 [Andreprevotia lacus DSM 23236]|jgi:hypothetical protein|uniref:Bacteriophage lambda head decoration protein D n=1 Tax=Andreprevotia lacus DSM 23236 TaxID=1121001 RepID=A0A1W1XTN9_9NEIS|nr:hypothetical protein [Andreprevotia lacus]SMC27215.1 hypothetical protein SAMN02745857_02754 [Andreprevotia lacus DSM 23236]
MAIEGTLPAVFKVLPPTTFTAAGGTVGRVLVDQQPAAPGATPPLYGGATLIDLTATSSDATARDLMLYTASVSTVVGSASTGAAAVTIQTITRVSGDFIADGWRAGALLMLFAPANAAPQAAEGVLAIVTGVASQTLTVSGTPFSAVGSLTAGTRICQLAPRFRATIPASAGSDGLSASVGLLNHVRDGALIRSELKLDAGTLLVAAPVAAISALPTWLSLSPVVALY